MRKEIVRQGGLLKEAGELQVTNVSGRGHPRSPHFVIDVHVAQTEIPLSAAAVGGRTQPHAKAKRRLLGQPEFTATAVVKAEVRTVARHIPFIFFREIRAATGCRKSIPTT